MFLGEEIFDSRFEFFHFVGGVFRIITWRIGENDLQVVGTAIGVVDFLAAIHIEIDGGQKIAEAGIRLESLAKIQAFYNGEVVFS